MSPRILTEEFGEDEWEDEGGGLLADDDVCPVCDAELYGDGRPCEYCDHDPLAD